MSKNTSLKLYEIYTKPGASCDYHRITLPFENLKANPKVPIYIFNRVPKPIPGLFERLKKMGVKIICDLDDYWFLHKEHYLYLHFKDSDNAKRIMDSLKAADAVITTTATLADHIKEFNRNVFVIPNALPFDTGQFQKSKDKESDTPFIYVGGASHRKDLELISGMDKGLTIAGFSFDPEWYAIQQAHTQAEFKNQLPLDCYMDAYDGHRIAIAPLAKNTFNECKSNLKILEAGCKGIPIITSKCLPYYNPIDKDVVTYANNKEEWRYALHRLWKDRIYSYDKGQELAEHVRKHYSLDKVNALRRELLESFR